MSNQIRFTVYVVSIQSAFGFIDHIDTLHDILVKNPVGSIEADCCMATWKDSGAVADNWYDRCRFFDDFHTAKESVDG